MTEYNLSNTGTTPVGPDEVAPESSVTLTPADGEHFQAKALLRSLVPRVSKGFSREYFFQAARRGARLDITSESVMRGLFAPEDPYFVPRVLTHD